MCSACASFARGLTFESKRNYHARSNRSVTRISFLTDVEGDWCYLKRFVTNSKILRFRDEVKEDKIEFVDDKSQLVYGGDVSALLTNR